MPTTNEEIQSLVKEQKAFFNTGQTKDAVFRQAQLNTLQQAIGENRSKILDALQQDLSKSAYEGYPTEVGIVLDEIRFIKKHLFTPCFILQIRICPWAGPAAAVSAAIMAKKALRHFHTRKAF